MFVLTGTLLGQAAADPPVAPADPKPAVLEGAKEVKPEVFYLQDKDGKLWPVPGMKLSDFQRLYDLDRGLKTEKPQFSLPSIKIDGQVRDDKAELDVAIKIVAMADTWIRVPLRFTSSVLREPPTNEGEGEFFLDYEPDGDGYICWLKAPVNSEHILRCKFLTKVQSSAGESRIALAAPRTTSGNLNLKVPEAKASAKLLRRTEDDSPRVRPDGSGSMIEALFPGGDFQVTWRAGGAVLPRQRQTIESTGAITVKLEGKRRITCEARLSVRSFGTPLDAITVRLPPGMRLASFDQTGLQLTVLEPEIDEASQKQVQLVEVRLAAKTHGPVEVPLVAEYLRENGAADQLIEIGGFEVLDAVKQSGTIDLLVEGDQSAMWLEGAGVRRVDDTSVELRSMKPLAKFEYDTQPFSLRVQVVPRRTRVTVEPLYIVYVENQQLRLDATLKYKVRGAKALNVQYDFEGWTIDRVGPETLVQSDSLLPENKSPLAIPLATTAIPASGEFELKVQAHRDLPADSREVRFEVPRPVGSNLTPGSLVVVPGDNIELTARSADLQGLVPDPLPSTLKLPPRQQPPQFYRELGGGAVARYMAALEVRPQMVSATSVADVRIDAGRASVEQTLAYNIAYEPLRHLELDVPTAQWESGEMQILLDGNAHSAMQIPPPADQAITATGRTRIRVDLMADRIGRVELSLRWVMPLPQIQSDPVSLAVPLALAVIDGNSQKMNMTVRVRHSDRLEATSSDEAWSVAQSFRAGELREPNAAWTHPTGAPGFVMVLKMHQAGNAGLITVDRAWVQTWLASDRRQDRAVFRLTTAAERLRIQMPPAIREGELIVGINGRRSISPRLLDADGVLTLELPTSSAAADADYVVELWYEFAGGRPDVGSMQLTPPQVLGAGDARRSYWQLVTPANEHLLMGPQALSADMRWRWGGTHFRRAGRLSQGDLEQWIGASVQADLPAATNAFLFSGFGSLPDIEIRTAARRTVLLACSGLVLVAGLALVYLPVARHPASLLLGGVVVASLAVWSPDAAILAAQAALAGLACALLARLLAGLYGRRRVSGVSLRAPSLSAVEAKSTEPHHRHDHGSHATTATMPLATVPLESER